MELYKYDDFVLEFWNTKEERKAGNVIGQFLVKIQKTH